MELQHRLEMQRIERQQAYEMKLMQERRAAAQAEAEAEKAKQQRLAAERQAAQEAELRIAIQEVAAVHPDWQEIRDSQSFKDWAGQQPQSVQNLRNSSRSGDAILIIDLYKRDRELARKKAKKGAKTSSKSS